MCLDNTLGLLFATIKEWHGLYNFVVCYKSEFLVDISEINITTRALAFWFKNLTTLEEN